MAYGDYLSISLGWLTCNKWIQFLGALHGLNETFSYKKSPIIDSISTHIISRGICDDIFISFYIESQCAQELKFSLDFVR